MMFSVMASEPSLIAFFAQPIRKSRRLPRFPSLIESKANAMGKWDNPDFFLKGSIDSKFASHF